MGDMRDEMAKFAKAHNMPLNNGGSQKKKDEHKPKRKDAQHSSGKHDIGDNVPRRVLPLYKDFKNFPEFKPDDILPIKPKGTANTGLLFDKFCDHWSGPDKWKEQMDERKKVPDELKNNPSWNRNPKTWFLNTIADHQNSHTLSKCLLDQYHARMNKLVETLQGESRTFATTWRFVSGLGMGHVLETGFIWHRTLGVPYLPCSSVKGLIRALVDPGKNGGDNAKWDEAKRLFGDTTDLGVGSLIVFDAIPEAKPKLEVDIMNPHYGDYYNTKGKTNPIPPADYLSPNPIFFLTVAEGYGFCFAFAPRTKEAIERGDVQTGFDLLTEALQFLGAGAKTAVGYGYFVAESQKGK